MYMYMYMLPHILYILLGYKLLVFFFLSVTLSYSILPPPLSIANTHLHSISLPPFCLSNTHSLQKLQVAGASHRSSSRSSCLPRQRLTLQQAAGPRPHRLSLPPSAQHRDGQLPVPVQRCRRLGRLEYNVREERECAEVGRCEGRE